MFSNRPKSLLYSQNGKVQISILSVLQTKELITDTGNRDQVFLATPLSSFSNLPEPLSISSCVKTYETCEVELVFTITTTSHPPCVVIVRLIPLPE